jgi:CBS domain-containing protein
MKVQSCMSRPVEYVTPDETVEDAARLMAEIDAGFLPVVDHGEIVGVISDRDIAIRAIGCGEGPETAVTEVMSRNVICCHADDEVDFVLDSMGNHQVRRLPVVDEAEQIVGIVSLSDLADISERESGHTLNLIARPSMQHSQDIA